MNVAVIGTGYVGLVTGTVLSEIGHTVVCLDTDENKINTLIAGVSPIFEPGLEELLQRNMELGRLHFTTKTEQAFKDSKVIFIAVGTPQGEDGAANLTYLKQAAKDIAFHVVQDVVVVVKSTVPVGANDMVEQIIRQYAKPGLDIQVVSNPEFLREGHAVQDTLHGDRIVIGADNEKAGDLVESVFNPIRIPILRTDRRSAEMIKYASNAFLAVKISYINQISNLCEALGADIRAVSDGMGMDRRIGREFLNAGLGYGGSCFPKDTEALVNLGRKSDISMSIVESAIQANKEQRQLFVDKVLRHFEGDVNGKKIAVLGLAFKPNTDDMREAPSIDIISSLVAKGARIVVYDPVVKHTPLFDQFNLTYASNIDECVTKADATLLVTEWEEFIQADWSSLSKLMKSEVIFDGRNMLKTHEVETICY
ncbi:UDP-glucose/GDP-mannose dehydrogenase family protein [Paenibacillus sp. DXFW5]|uniref:UDP-glucose 6-dehydrogenase n=1 Tax=Paenibacillus rhizolycopersici TaxID=2780073 RepID=A0ABS2H749_9BACL|nr:UDP-glucose/GDP-mannose dehydrogenase family protein [Paenibacillus rhizolycopersici]MBM6997262.1 UDP-glucose/GDP-mannose dehydrogenase family protein [Paenibacillus rhizolycopersici]